ncbi:MAG TPA: hypothetical protein VIY48_14105 [Candidatus Paceibacterota bacterium]
MKRLWEIDHPYYGADGVWTEDFESFAEMRESVDASDEDYEHVYRWDWIDYTSNNYVLSYDGEGPEQVLRLFVVCPRKSQFGVFECPVTHGDEPEILEWRRGPRIFGSLKKMWEPILDDVQGGNAE